MMSEDLLREIIRQLAKISNSLDVFLNSREEQPEKVSTQKEKKKTTTEEQEVYLSDVQIIRETEKAFIVQRASDLLVAVVAKSHLAKKYSKSDIRRDLEFKPNRAWALEKLEWKEDKK